MKIQITTLLLMSGLLALMNVPTAAQEKPMPPSSPEEVKRPNAVPPVETSHSSRSTDQKPAAYLGVLTVQVSRELRAQFGLADGFGLQVAEVMPDSPAQEAGLKEHDVLVTFEDQKLVNMEQLQTLVRAKKKDDAVNLSIITGGQAKQISIKIGERMMAVNQDRPRGFMPGLPNMHGSDWGNTDQWRASAEEFQRRTGEYQERIREWNREGHRGQMPQPPMFEGPGRKDTSRRENDRGPRDNDSQRTESADKKPRGDTHHFEHRESHESANVTRSDDTGIYSLHRNDGRQVFTVKPKEGEEKSWPVNNEQERAAVPEPFQGKLREMDQIRSNMRSDKANESELRLEAEHGDKGPAPSPKKPADGI